jgi:hypothetical protein
MTWVGRLQRIVLRARFRLALVGDRATKGRPGTHSKVAVVYVYPTDGDPRHDFCARRFVETYLAHEAGFEHGLHVVFNGEAPSDEQLSVFAGTGFQALSHDDAGWDIGAFQRAATCIDCDVMVFFGGHSYFVQSGWLARMVGAFQKHGRGLYGASASYQIDPHLRTTGFWCSPSLVRAYPKAVRTYTDRYQFEHGDMSLTRLAQSAGLDCWLVTWDQVLGPDHWRSPESIFWRGGQRSALVRDRLFDFYDDAGVERPFYSALADGWGPACEPQVLERALRQLPLGEGVATTVHQVQSCDRPWTVLARAVAGELRCSTEGQALLDELVERIVRGEGPALDQLLFGELGLAPYVPIPRRVAKLAILVALGLSEELDRWAPSSTEAWALLPGMRLRGIRSLFLRVLQPFVERQNAINSTHSIAVALLGRDLDEGDAALSESGRYARNHATQLGSLDGREREGDEACP